MKEWRSDALGGKTRVPYNTLYDLSRDREYLEEAPKRQPTPYLVLVWVLRKDLTPGEQEPLLAGKSIYLETKNK